ncbi:DUF4190 domain-containing protein [Streptomyces sp. GC420]|uniref:DUF4190 domain-containing protein n=1 Tax=Streptomyces sp. GC420 TaxID=2697568 RepID=UPI001415101B|nr:DUF4190 domain-containing protein [Streptomyces sp. GC420]NBM15306.1 DUF4190 domain-containing protein [Streptomyces sp. GC420]
MSDSAAQPPEGPDRPAQPGQSAPYDSADPYDSAEPTGSAGPSGEPDPSARPGRGPQPEEEPHGTQSPWTPPEGRVDLLKETGRPAPPAHADDTAPQTPAEPPNPYAYPGTGTATGSQGGGPGPYARYGLPAATQGGTGYPGYPGYGAGPAYGSHPGYPGYPGYQGWGVYPQPQNGYGTAAMVLGIVAVCLFCAYGLGMILGVLAIVFGILGRKRVRRGEATNPGQAVAGIVLGVVSIVITAVVVGLIVWAISTEDERGHDEWEDDPYATSLVVGAPAPAPAPASQPLSVPVPVSVTVTAAG